MKSLFCFSGHERLETNKRKVLHLNNIISVKYPDNHRVYLTNVFAGGNYPVKK